MRHTTVCVLLWLVLSAETGCGVSAPRMDPAHATGNVIFIHPDGASLNHWNAARIRWVGPDADLNWDRLPAMAVYRSHMRDSLNATSHGGGTVHAYGVKVPADSYGMDGQTGPLTARSGSRQSIMEEARAAGMAIGIVNSGDQNEPGTGCFLAHVPSRKMSESIVAQVVASGADIIMGGGERWYLPAATAGRHGPGSRTDGRNLVAEAGAAGYTVVFDRDELAAAARDPQTRRLLGIFAHAATFHDESEEALAERSAPLYVPTAPTLAEMTDAALTLLGSLERQFLLVIEEEGTDNFPNHNNARGTLEALRRADEAIGVARAFVDRRRDTLLITAADSDASGLQVLGGYPPSGDPVITRQPLPAQVRDGGPPLDGRDGTATLPFESAPDAAGRTHPFAIAWGGGPYDTYGAVLVRAAGLNAHLVNGNFDNTDVYRVMYRTLFGVVRRRGGE